MLVTRMLHHCARLIFSAFYVIGTTFTLELGRPLFTTSTHHFVFNFFGGICGDFLLHILFGPLLLCVVSIYGRLFLF